MKMKKGFLEREFGEKQFTPGEVVRIKRKAWGMTQKDISEITGLSESNISHYENGRLEIGWSVANKLAVAIGVHPMTILFPNGESFDKSLEKMAERASRFRDKKLKKAS